MADTFAICDLFLKERHVYCMYVEGVSSVRAKLLKFSDTGKDRRLCHAFLVMIIMIITGTNLLVVGW